jgi:1,4-alpha-glucan branching enzyme
MAKKAIRAGPPSGAGMTDKRVFTFAAPAASQVMLVGDFTDWQRHPIGLRKCEDGSWQAEVQLPPGDHHYRFLVDGQWQDDPRCTQRVPNPFGTQDCVCQVG